jgi:uncharacterized protein YigA (DUF484 family)
MSSRALSRDPSEAAAEAVKAYLRMNRARIATDSEWMALLLPDRFGTRDIGDLQRFLIEKLRGETFALRAELEGLMGRREQAARLGDGVRSLVLDLLDARTFDEAISVARASAPVFGGARAALCVEGDGSGPKGCEGVRLIAPGTAAAVLGREGSGAVLSRGGELLLGSGGNECRSIAVFRLRLGCETPACVYAVGAREPGRFDGDEATADIGFFARALERSIRAWLDLPKV